MYRGRAYGGYAHPLLHWLIVTAVIAGTVAVTVYLVNRFMHRTPAVRPQPVPPMSPMGPVGPPRVGPPDPALDHARLRYASGEMSRDDYLRIVGDLTGVAQAQPPAPQPPAT